MATATQRKKVELRRRWWKNEEQCQELLIKGKHKNIPETPRNSPSSIHLSLYKIPHQQKTLYTQLRHFIEHIARIPKSLRHFVEHIERISLSHSSIKPQPKMSLIPTLFGNRSVYDPFSSELWAPIGVNNEVSSFANTQVDWKETPVAHILKADLPGLKKEEVKVEVEDGGVIQISGERGVEKEEKNEKWHRVERAKGKFIRKFRLPQNAKVDEVKASMENGVLTVTVPKLQEEKPAIKSIEISG